jgi:hypothetical protein
MRLYVRNYQIEARNDLHPIHEMGMSAPIAVMRGPAQFDLHCDFVPVLDEGESSEDIMKFLVHWISGAQINIVSALPDKPRCYYCGTMNDTGGVKCKYCGGEMR